MDCSSSVHGILQARIPEWVAIPFSRGFSLPRDLTQVSCIAGRFFTIWATRETLLGHPSLCHCKYPRSSKLKALYLYNKSYFERDNIHVTFVLGQWTRNDTGLNCADPFIHVLSFPVNTHYSIPQLVDTIRWILMQNHRLAGLTVKLYADFWLKWRSAFLTPIFFKSQLSVVTVVLFYY